MAVRDFEKQTVMSVKVAVPTKIGTQPNSTTCSLELLRVLVGIEFLVSLKNLSQKILEFWYLHFVTHPEKIQLFLQIGLPCAELGMIEA